MSLTCVVEISALTALESVSISVAVAETFTVLTGDN
jgi:hypothetical protein